MPEALLELRDVHGFYGGSHALQGVSLRVEEGEVVTLLGRNGAGKTTTLRAIMGLLAKRHGSITFRDRQLINMKPERIARLGLGYCPEERGIFASLTTLENLLLPPLVRPGGMSLTELFELFPNLKERRRSGGAKLSGGEQQMLAIARILRTGAKLLLLDEPTEGLAPVIVQHIGSVIRRLKSSGFTILLVEQNFHFASRLADRQYVMEQGVIVDEISQAQVTDKMPELRQYLGV